MLCRFAVLLALIPLLLISVIQTGPSPGCCPAGRDGQPVVNADQTVVMIWDAEKKVQHFIRQATFRSEDTDVGFLVPTPSVPELEESGNDAFPLLAQFTAPEIKYLAKPPARGGGGCGCGGVDPDLEARNAPAAGVVQVLAQKQVAGFDAQVLAATTSESLVEWLNAHGYSFSPEVATWAEPYIRDGWKITALQVARRAGETADGGQTSGADRSLRLANLVCHRSTSVPLSRTQPGGGGEAIERSTAHATHFLRCRWSLPRRFNPRTAVDGPRGLGRQTPAHRSRRTARKTQIAGGTPAPPNSG
jgi:hypothetical protein